MARVYADLIRKGKINIENVPVKIRTEVEAILNAQTFALFIIYNLIFKFYLTFKGKKTYAQVPEKIKPQVRQVLIDLECEDLIVEE